MSDTEVLPDGKPMDTPAVIPDRPYANDNRALSVFGSGHGFSVAMEMARMLSESTMVPDQYQAYNLKNGQWVHNPVGVGNCIVALEFSSRMGLSPFTIMQNMDVIKGKPGFRGKFNAGLVNHSPLFSRIAYEWRSEKGKDEYGCRAYATSVDSGQVLYGVWIDWKMVKAEKWDTNPKWHNMTEQMFMYRAASFWVNAHAPELTLGLPTVEEIEDVAVVTQDRRASARDLNARIRHDLAAGAGQGLETDGEVVEPDPEGVALEPQETETPADTNEAPSGVIEPSTETPTTRRRAGRTVE